MEPDSTAVINSSSVSKARAFPVKLSPSFPVIFATAPPGARLPRRILCVPRLVIERDALSGIYSPNVSSRFERVL
jgi:hypothetical protein